MMRICIHILSSPHGRNNTKVDYQLTHKTMSKKESKTFLIGRNSETGELTTVEEARKHSKTHTVERMPKQGYGDTDRGKKK